MPQELEDVLCSVPVPAERCASAQELLWIGSMHFLHAAHLTFFSESAHTCHISSAFLHPMWQSGGLDNTFSLCTIKSSVYKQGAYILLVPCIDVLDNLCLIRIMMIHQFRSIFHDVTTISCTNIDSCNSAMA